MPYSLARAISATDRQLDRDVTQSRAAQAPTATRHAPRSDRSDVCGQHASRQHLNGTTQCNVGTSFKGAGHQSGARPIHRSFACPLEPLNVAYMEALFSLNTLHSTKMSFIPFLISALHGGGRYTPLYAEKETRYPLYMRRGWSQDRPGTGVENLTSTGVRHVIVQPVACRYTD